MNFETRFSPRQETFELEHQFALDNLLHSVLQFINTEADMGRAYSHIRYHQTIDDLTGDLLLRIVVQ